MCPRLRGKGGGDSHQRGNAFPTPAGRLCCMVSAAKGDIYTGAPKGAHLASAAILYTSRGRSPQTVREASAGPGQNPWRPGPKARRRHQPSPAKAGVNLWEYWKAPPRSRSRSRPTVSPGFPFLSIKKLPSRGKGVFFSSHYLMSYMPLTPSLRLM